MILRRCATSFITVIVVVMLAVGPIYYQIPVVAERASDESVSLHITETVLYADEGIIHVTVSLPYEISDGIDVELSSVPPLTFSPPKRTLSGNAGTYNLVFNVESLTHLSQNTVNITVKASNSTGVLSSTNEIIQILPSRYFQIEYNDTLEMNTTTAKIPIAISSTTAIDQNLSYAICNFPEHWMINITWNQSSAPWILLPSWANVELDIILDAPKDIHSGKYNLSLYILSPYKNKTVDITINVPPSGTVELFDVNFPDFVYENDTVRSTIVLKSTANHQVRTELSLCPFNSYVFELKYIALSYGSRASEHQEILFGPGELNTSNYQDGTLLVPMDTVSLSNMTILMSPGVQLTFEMCMKANSTGMMGLNITMKNEGNTSVFRMISVPVVRYDLKISGIYYVPKTPVIGEICTVLVDIENMGQHPSSDIVVRLYVNSELKDSVTIKRINPGGKTPVSFTWYVISGKNTIQVELEPADGSGVIIANTTDTVDLGSDHVHDTQSDTRIAIWLLALFLVGALAFLSYVAYRDSKKKGKMYLERLANRYRQSGRPHPDLNVDPGEYDGKGHMVRLAIPEPNADGVPWTACMTCGEKLEYPEYMCPNCGADQRELYELYTKEVCIWCGANIDRSWMKVIDKCDGYVEKGVKCDEGPFCSEECLKEHKEMKPHYRDLDND